MFRYGMEVKGQRTRLTATLELSFLETLGVDDPDFQQALSNATKLGSVRSEERPDGHQRLTFHLGRWRLKETATTRKVTYTAAAKVLRTIMEAPKPPDGDPCLKVTVSRHLLYGGLIPMAVDMARPERLDGRLGLQATRHMVRVANDLRFDPPTSQPNSKWIGAALSRRDGLVLTIDASTGSRLAPVFAGQQDLEAPRIVIAGNVHYETHLFISLAGALAVAYADEQRERVGK